MDLIAKEKDFSSKETLDKLGINAIEKFDVNSSELPEGVKTRKEELNTENKELVAFYDETTNKIFINKDIEDENEIRALIAREWKISEDLKSQKGKANDNGQLRATVAGEIAYEEIKSRAEKGKVNKFDSSSLENAVMDKDTVVSADKYGEIKEGIENILSAIGKHSAITSEIDNNPNILDENKDEKGKELKKETANLFEKIDENIDYMKDGLNRPEYIENELPRLEKEILAEKDPLKKSILEARKEYLRREINYYNNNGRELVKGAVVGAVATGAAIVAPVATTAIAVGGAVISAITDKEEKIELSKIQLTQLQETAPEFYRENKDLFVISDTANTKTSDVLSMAKDFYSNTKTPDEKLSREIGNIIGGAVASRAISGIKNTIKVAETSNHKPTLVITNEVKQNSVYPNFDFDHVIGGDVSKNGKKVTGGHSLTKGDVRISEIIDKADINGIYNAEVEIYNPKTQKWEIKKSNTTMFPKDWSENRIKEEIRSAWNSSNFKVTITNRGKEWSGTADSGIKIKGFINKDKTTAFPEYEGGK